MESTGTIEATEVDVRSEVGGKIVVLRFDEGDRVRRGDVLAEIDHEKLDYQLPHAKERLREAEARLALAVEAFRDEEVQKARKFVLETEIQYATYLMPLRYFAIIVRGISLKGVGLEVPWQDALILFTLGLVILSVSIVRLRKKVL